MIKSPNKRTGAIERIRVPKRAKPQSADKYDELRLANEALVRSESRLNSILESAMDAIITVDENQDIVLFNAAAEALFGCPRGQAIGTSLNRFIPERFRAAHTVDIRHFGERGATTRRMGADRIVIGLRRDGEEFPVDASISRISDQGHKFYTVILRDVTERVRAQEALERGRLVAGELAEARGLQAALERLSATDSLTGLANRRRIDEALQLEFDRSRRYGSEFALLMCDLDHFKRINDEHGHETGDRVLVAFAEIVRKLTRESDIAGRYGGEEFLLILPNIGPQGAMTFAERLRAGVESGRLSGLPATVSIGAAAASEVRPQHVRDIVRAADAALYEAKGSGRNRVCLARPIAP